MRLVSTVLIALAVGGFGVLGQVSLSAQEFPPVGRDVPELARRCNGIDVRQRATSMGLDGDDPPALRAIRRELEQGGADAVTDVLESLPHSLLLRRIASPVLARHPSDKTRSALARLLTDEDERVAARAADGLGLVGGAEVIDGLVVAVSDRRRAVRHNALNALNVLGAADHAVDATLEVLQVGDAASRTSAAQLLAELRGRAHLERAAAALDRRADLEQLRDVHAVVLRARRMVALRLGD